MKNLFLLFFLIFFSYSIKAQDIAKNTVGVRLGADYGIGLEATYQHLFFGDKRIEIGVAWYDDLDARIIRGNFTLQKVMPLAFLDNLNGYAGIGGGLGFWSSTIDIDNGIFIELDGIAGIEYKFGFPLVISFDVKPGISSLINNNSPLRINHNVGVGIRYILDF